MIVSPRLLRLLRLLRLRQMVTISQQPSEEEEEVGSRNEEMEEEKRVRGPDYGHIYKSPAAVKIHSGRYTAG